MPFIDGNPYPAGSPWVTVEPWIVAIPFIDGQVVPTASAMEANIWVDQE